MQDTWTEVDRYISETFVQPDATLEAVLENAAREGIPPVHVSPSQGKLLAVLARSVHARCALEIGTLAGYSAIWLGRALLPGGKLLTLEARADYAAAARRNLLRAGLQEVVEVRVGPALESLPVLARQMPETFDFVFIDADKSNNAAYFGWALRLTRPGSLIVLDNVVRNGAVLRTDGKDESVRGVRECFSLIETCPRVTATVIQTVGVKGYDGFAIALVTD